MKLKPALILVTSLTACSFQTQASLCNGGFEDGFTCWGNLTEEFGYREVISSYTDGRGITFTPTEGTSFLNLWGNNDLAQRFSWSAGDQLSFDWAVASGTNPSFSRVRLSAALFEALSPFETFSLSATDLTTFNTFSYTFTEASPTSSGLVFQALGTPPYRDFFMPDNSTTNAEVGHILIDNVQFTHASDTGGGNDPGTGVPEPDSALLMGIALLFGWTHHMTRKRQIAIIRNPLS